MVLIGTVLGISGCHSATEVSGSVQSSVTFISTSDFSIVNTLEGIEDGRSICSINSTLFFVYNSSGRLYRIDSGEMVIDTSFTIDTGTGQPSFDMTSPPPRTSLFVLGSGGKIVHVSIESSTIVGTFSPGPSTVALCSSRSMPYAMIYAVDGQDDYVREINPSSYNVERSDLLMLTPSCVTMALNEDSLLVGSEVDAAYSFVKLSSTSMSARPPIGIGAVNDVVPFNSSEMRYFASLPQWGSGSGYVARIEPPEPSSRGGYSVSGNPVKVSADSNGQYLYVLSNTGSGTSLVTVIDELYGWVIAEIPVIGYPWDMAVHGEYLVVLTSGG
jgi:DNA-binding beta-propeller fold protein YncE